MYDSLRFLWRVDHFVSGGQKDSMNIRTGFLANNCSLYAYAIDWLLKLRLHQSCLVQIELLGARCAEVKLLELPPPPPPLLGALGGGGGGGGPGGP